MYNTYYLPFLVKLVLTRCAKSIYPIRSVAKFSWCPNTRCLMAGDLMSTRNTNTYYTTQTLESVSMTTSSKGQELSPSSIEGNT